MDVTGTSAIVTGGASGLGAGTARGLAAAGSKVAIFDMNMDVARQVASDIGGIAIECDVSDAGSAEAAVAAARDAHGDGVQVLTATFADNDRARAERRTEGLVKAVVDRRGRILGAGIVGDHAGELLQPWCLAISKKLKIGAMAGVIAPYPTLGEVNKRAAGSYYTPKIFSDRMRRIVRLIAKLPG